MLLSCVCVLDEEEDEEDESDEEESGTMGEEPLEPPAKLARTEFFD